jgi:hypothetical protein
VGDMSLVAVPITMREAMAFVARHHRHHRPPRSGVFAIGCSDWSDDEPSAEFQDVIGVAIVGRPVARMAANGWTAEVTRVATNGHKNACSFLYGACWRAAKAIGYVRLITYTLPEEGGTSLRAAGWKCLGETGGGTWSRKARPRFDEQNTQRKLAWEAA